MSKNLSDLQEVFVPFKTSRVKGGSVLFFNEEITFGLTREDLIAQCCFIVNPETSNGESLYVEPDSEKIFFAERYGGERIFKNGGGGRCGFDGRFQIKGIGPNQLIGADVEQVDRNGVLDVENAVYEVIWAEIINFSLPYGAIRSSAIIDLGFCYSYEGKNYARALLVRQPAVRPAHFLRATYFKNSGSKAGEEDVARVKASIKKIVDFLPKAQNENINSEYDILSERLLELAKRYAAQFAASRAKQIYHNNISGSNLSIDGKWIDLSSAKIFTSLKGGDKRDIMSFETEHISAMKSIGGICYHLAKYSVVSESESKTILKKIAAAFIKSYNRDFGFYSVVKAGFSPCLIRRVNKSSAYLEFSHSLRRILAFDNYAVTPLSTELGWAGYEHWGFRLYINLLKEVAHGASQDYAFLNVSAELVTNLVSSYICFFEQLVVLAQQEDISRKSLIRGMLFNIVRLNRSSEMLFELSKGIKDIAKSDATCFSTAYNDFIGEVIRSARLEFEDELDFKVPLWYGADVSLYFDILNEKFMGHIFGDKTLCVESLTEMAIYNSEVQLAISFYGKIWAEFYEKNI